MTMAKKILHKLKSNKGDSNLISSIVSIVCITVVFLGCILIFSQGSRIDNLQRMANQMAREISLTGITDGETLHHLNTLKSEYKMDGVTMSVEGAYIGSSKKLRLESDFTVTLFYDTKYGMDGIIRWGRGETYRAKASGKVEEYHKTS